MTAVPRDPRCHVCPREAQGVVAFKHEAMEGLRYACYAHLETLADLLIRAGADHVRIYPDHPRGQKVKIVCPTCGVGTVIAETT